MRDKGRMPAGFEGRNSHGIPIRGSMLSNSLYQLLALKLSIRFIGGRCLY